ncbi:DUF2637 domain-containing protein [Nocardia brasiliensis]|uniref:DUF2637 domain-containing protein n=1 Tax=Nocardia brasiliensis TaxID=37326 RepID=UPI003787771D
MTAPRRTPRGRLVSWTGFVFGSVTSIAANILHTWLPAASMPAGWTPGIAPQVGAAVWPIGLLLSVEVLSRARWRRGLLWALARYGGAGAVAIGSAVISYSHLREVLLTWGYGSSAAYVGPLVLDGLMVVSGFALLSMTLDDETTTPAAEPVVTTEAATEAAVADIERPAVASDRAEPGPVDVPVLAVPDPVMPATEADTGHTSEADTDADTRRAKARHLSDQGWTHARIAAELEVSKRTVRRYLSTHDTSPATGTGGNDEPTPVVDAAPINSNHHQPLEGVLS